MNAPLTSANQARYRKLSLWLDTAGDDLTPRPPLQGDTAVDVAIVGAGFTGLWTAYTLLGLDPGLRVLVVEREIAGFGASGRNGGWCSDLFPVSWDRVAREAGEPAAVAMHRAMVAGIGDVEATLRREGIDADFWRGGSLTLAMTAVHERQLRAEVAAARPGLEAQWLNTAALRGRLRADGARGAMFTPFCARLHPAKLVRGLARAVEARGGRIVEQTAVQAVVPHALVTGRGRVRADVVVRATEGYTPTLPGARRVLLPLYSLMIATEPLPDRVWAELGWDGAETVTDGRHLIIYAQRTADGRIAFGGRGAPYHFGSRVEPRFDRVPAVFNDLAGSLHELFPATRGAAITHRWGGPLGASRDWFPSIGLDRTSGLAWAGGYVGDGVTAANVAGRTLADLITGRATDLTRLPWVRPPGRRWEPEPLRWLGANLGVWAMRGADAAERRSGRPSRRAQIVERIQGH